MEIANTSPRPDKKVKDVKLSKQMAFGAFILLSSQFTSPQLTYYIIAPVSLILQPPSGSLGALHHLLQEGLVLWSLPASRWSVVHQLPPPKPAGQTAVYPSYCPSIQTVTSRFAYKNIL